MKLFKILFAALIAYVDHDLLVAKLSKELAKLRAYELTEKLIKSKR